MPFCHLRLNAKKPVNKGYPEKLITIGDHIRKHRLDRGLLQKEVALLIGVNKSTIINWELGHRSPALWTLPEIIKFLGYVPFGWGESLPERLRAYRMIHGTSRKKLAGLLGVDEGTLWRWETGQRRPAEKYAARIERMIAGGACQSASARFTWTVHESGSTPVGSSPPL